VKANLRNVSRIAATLELSKQVLSGELSSAEVESAQQLLTSHYMLGLSDPVVLSDTLTDNEVYGLERTEIIQFPPSHQSSYGRRSELCRSRVTSS
jgi:predicted Zn-dependent peptidase